MTIVSQEAIRDMEIATEIVNKEFDVDVVSRSRKKHVVGARMVLAKILKDRKHSYAVIARMMEKDHNTISHYLRVLAWDIEFDTKFGRRYDSCMLEFESKMSGIPKRYLKIKKEIKALSLDSVDTEKLLFISNLICHDCSSDDEVKSRIDQVLSSLKQD